MQFLDRQRRYVEMVSLAAQHDLAFVLDRVGLSSMIPETFRSRDASTPGLTDAERVRRLFEVLGPTFVKMGQILSTRPDLIPRTFIDELKKLQDHVTTVPFDAMRPIAEAELGAALEDVFAEVSTEPLAAASIGQVYEVTLKDGTRAVMKIQRPNIEDTIRTDVSILRSFAQLAQATGLTEPFDPVAIVREFERTILRELDYVTEGRQTDAFREQHADDPELVIPLVFWEHTGKRVLTLERIDGIKVSEIERLGEAGHDLPKIARKLVHVILRQVLLLDRFHADPHPGNLLVLDDGRLALIDFGMAGGFDRFTRRALADLMRDLSERDAHALADHLLQHGYVDYDADLRAMRRKLRDLFRSLSGGAQLPELMETLLRFITDHRLAFPPDLFFLDKVFGTLEGSVKTLDPKLSMRQLAGDFMPTLASGLTKEVPELARELLTKLLAADEAWVALPQDLRRLMQRADAGHLRVNVVQEPSAGSVRAASRRLAAGGVLAMGLAWTVAGLAGGSVLPPGAELGIGLACSAVALGWLWFDGGR